MRVIVDEKENQQTVQKELKQELLLCDSRGRLNPEAVGWARHPYPVMNVHGNFPFRKSLERWEVHAPEGVLSAACALSDHTALIRAEFVRAGNSGAVSRSVSRGFPEARRFSLPERWSAPVALEMDGVSLSVTPAVLDGDVEPGPEREGVAGRIGRGIRKLKERVTRKGMVDRMAVSFTGDNGEPVRADISATRAVEQESLNVMAAWTRRRFVWVSRTVYPECSGQVSLVGGDVLFTPGRSATVREVVRGVFPLQMSGQRAVCLYRSGKEFCGLMAGTDWARGTGMNENALLLGGRLYKLFDAVRFVPGQGGQLALRTLSSSAVDLVFEPQHESVAEGKFLFLRVFTRRRTGVFSGEIRVGQKRFSIAAAPGSVEDFQYLG